MSSINPHYTLNYSQPEAYRFSHDSVFLARQVFERVAARVRPDWRVLDLCAGCGVVGLDFLFHCREADLAQPARVDFLEVQDEVYRPHFIENVQRFGEAHSYLNFVAGTFTEPPPSTYDLILCNPPYFNRGSGKLSPSEFKNRCRFFMDGDKPELISFVRQALKPEGRAYILMREVPEGARTSGDIRGTPLVEITSEV